MDRQHLIVIPLAPPGGCFLFWRVVIPGNDPPSFNYNIAIFFLEKSLTGKLIIRSETLQDHPHSEIDMPAGKIE
jgi:hypothetical protein